MLRMIPGTGEGQMLIWGKPFRGKELEDLKGFLADADLKYEEGIEYSVCLTEEDGRIMGCGCVEENVIKCVAVDKRYQGQGLLTMIMSEQTQYLYEKGRTHIFIYTKPKNLDIFADLGYYKVYRTDEILLLENREKGFASYLKKLRDETPEEALPQRGAPETAGNGDGTGRYPEIGAVVANCNPFTLGHRYLLEEALKQCDYLHLFVLSDNRGAFSAQERYEMVKRGIEGLEKVILHETSGYMISAATFPTYFFKDRMQGELANCRLDLELFGACIAPWLQITSRFVGTEPCCGITRAYNEEMKRILPGYGISVTEMERKTKGGMPISASEVRRSIVKGDFGRVKEAVPERVYRYLMENTGDKYAKD